MKKSLRENIKKSILNVVEDALDKVDDQYQTINEKALDTAGEIKESIGDVFSNVKSRAERAKDKTESYVRHNPEKSLLLAAGAGALAGLVLGGLAKKKG